MIYNKIKKNCLLILLLFISFFSFTACKSQKNDANFIYYISETPKNLDPQLAESENAELVLMNVAEGLMAYNEEAELVPGLAKSFTYSDDKKTLSFTLRNDINWVSSDGKKHSAISSADFIFAFKRLFLLNDNINIGELSVIKGFSEAAVGSAGTENLGISAPDDKTIVFELSEPSTGFLEVLSRPFTYPCKESFFEETKGEYGLSPEAFLSSGAFYLSRWRENGTLSLYSSGEYYDKSKLDVYSVSIREESDHDKLLQYFDEGDSHIIMAAGADEEKITIDTKLNEKQENLFVLALNSQNTTLSHPKIRRILLSALINTEFDIILPNWIRLEEKLSIPADDTPINHGELMAALAEVGLLEFPDINLYYPDNIAYTYIMQKLQKTWQESLAIFINIVPLSFEELEERKLSGDFDMIACSVYSKEENPQFYLPFFMSGSGENFIKFSDLGYDALLAALPLSAEDGQKAEALLWDSFLILKLGSERSSIFYPSYVSGIIVVPKKNIILFKYAKMNKST